MITSIIEMLELANYGYITIWQYNLSHQTELCSWHHFKIRLFLKKLRVARLAGIIKIATRFVQTTYKDSNKVKLFIQTNKAKVVDFW